MPQAGRRPCGPLHPPEPSHRPPTSPRWWRARLPGRRRVLLCALLAGVSACSPRGGYDVRAVVLHADGDPPATPPFAPRSGEWLGAGARVLAGSGNVTLGLVPGTVVALGPGGELHLNRLRILKNGSRMLGREVDLTLTTGDLDLLIVAPEEAAPTTVRLRTPAGEVLAESGCLAHFRVASYSTTTMLRVICARGELRCAGERLPAGHVGGFPGPPGARPIAGDGPAQLELGALLERGGGLQIADLQRQAQAPGWRSTSR